MFGTLDFIYVPCHDIDEGLDYYVKQLGAQLGWKVRDGATTVASIRLNPDGPQILLADHLEGKVPLLIYRVADLNAVTTDLSKRGWQPDGPAFEIPHGPCITFRDPNGQRLALYELVRPEANRVFAGRIDG